MDADLKAKWIAALRSGKHQQGRGKLRSEDGKRLCCLGVLCVVAGIPISKDGEFVDDNAEGYSAIHEILGNDELAQTFWWKNDRDGETFDEIADYIEKHIGADTSQMRQEK